MSEPPIVGWRLVAVFCGLEAAGVVLIMSVGWLARTGWRTFR